MRSLKWMGLLGVFAFVLGCNRSSDTASSSADQNENAPRAEGQQTAPLSPTSRDTNASSRLYPNSSDTNGAATAEPDNTGKNVQDRPDTALTPGDQGGSASDREITRRIRRAITSNDQLSADAKNIKIITIDGKVTLRGPVDSEQEAKTITSMVQQMGVTSLDNQLEVKATNQ